MYIVHSFIKFIVFLFFSLNAYSQNQIEKHQFILSGTIDKVDKGYVKLSYTDLTNKVYEDSCQIKEGEFLFKGKIKIVALANLSYISNKNLSLPNNIQLFLEENLTKVEISNDFKLKFIKGSTTQNYWNSLNGSNIYNKIDSISKVMQSSEYEKNDNLESDYRTLQKQSVIYDYEFAIKNSTSYLSPYLLSTRLERREISLDSIEIAFNRLTTKVKKSSFGIELKEKIQMRKSSAINQFAPDFVKNDINGNSIKLSSFRGKKNILLDFSASWCVPCKEQLPKLKELYKKYNKKDLDIIVVSWDLDEQSWKKGIQKEEMEDWYNVSGFFNPKSDGLRTLFSISNIPTLILINKQGVIIGRFDNNGKNLAIDDLESALKQIFTY